MTKEINNSIKMDLDEIRSIAKQNYIVLTESELDNVCFFIENTLKNFPQEKESYCDKEPVANLNNEVIPLRQDNICLEEDAYHETGIKVINK